MNALSGPVATATPHKLFKFAYNEGPPEEEWDFWQVVYEAVHILDSLRILKFRE